MLASDHVDAGQTGSIRHDDGLGTIASLLEMERYRLGEWDETYARLFAIDCASIVYRYLTPDLTDAARELVQRLIQEASRLATAGRDAELASIEKALMAGLESASRVTRPVWLVALNAVLPDPFRAATMSCEGSLLAFGRGPNPRRDAVAESVRRRLISRTEEASLLGSAGPLHRTPSAVA